MPTTAEKITAQSGMFSQNQVPITPPSFIGRSAPAPSCQPARAGPPWLNRAGLPSVLALKRLACPNEHMQRSSQCTKSRNRPSRADVATPVPVRTVRAFVQRGRVLVRTGRVFVQRGRVLVRTGRVFADDCRPLRARSLLV